MFSAKNSYCERDLRYLVPVVRLAKIADNVKVVRWSKALWQSAAAIKECSRRTQGK